MKKVEKRDPSKSGNSEFKSHFKHSSYLCQCHICALTIFYLWTVNVISPKWLLKLTMFRKGTPPPKNMSEFWIQIDILNIHHMCANVIFVHYPIFYLWTVKVIFPKRLVKWRKFRKGTPPKKCDILNSNHILNNHHIYANVIFVH